jgi:hypothetical protein
MRYILRFSLISALLAASAMAQYNAELKVLSAGPSGVAPKGRIDYQIRLTNLSGVRWEPIPPVWDCREMFPATKDLYEACPSFPSPTNNPAWGLIALNLFAYPMDAPNPVDNLAVWSVQLPLPGPVDPGETTIITGYFMAPDVPGRYILGPTLTRWGYCNFTSRVLNSAQDGFELSDHWEFRVGSDTTPPALSISGSLASSCSIWPLDGKMKEVGVIRASDTENSIAGLDIKVSSSDPGFTSGDVEVRSPSTDLRILYLRASRSGFLPGRTYSIEVQAMDTAGNKNVTNLSCTVPHDQRH